MIAEVAGTPESVVLDTAGERLKFTYSFQGPVYAYLQNPDDLSVAPRQVLLIESASNGEQEVAVAPGRYELVVRTDGTVWTIRVEDLALRG